MDGGALPRNAEECGGALRGGLHPTFCIQSTYYQLEEEKNAIGTVKFCLGRWQT